MACQDDTIKPDALTIDLETIDSVALRRLVEEVRHDMTQPSPTAYNRIYNRHNRS